MLHFLVPMHNEFILKLLDFALHQIFFSYQQVKGTSMGAPWAPTYACLHLILWEKEVVYRSPFYMLWLRYIDDVLML